MHGPRSCVRSPANNHGVHAEPFFSAFANVGVAVHAQDAHGMGKSEPFDEADRVFVRNVDNLVRTRC